MKMRYLVFCIGCLFLVFGCDTQDREELMKKARNEVIETERAFCKMAEEEGLQTAFVYFASEEAVLSRRGKIVKGKDSISNFYASYGPEVKLKWEPDFVEVSSSLDLAYTYGKYVFSRTDSTGTKENQGIFHTVWKKQEDGTWKYVYD